MCVRDNHHRGALRVPPYPGMKQLQDDPTGTLQALALEMGPTISLGTACGFASGFALKKAGKVAIVVRPAPFACCSLRAWKL